MTANDLVFSPRRRGKLGFWGSPWNFGAQSRPAGRCALIVSDTLAVVFIDALRGVPSPYGQLSEAAPPRLETTQGSEAQTAETGPCPQIGRAHV